MRTIDLENGNDVSKLLFRLYNRMAMNLIKANVMRNCSIVDEVIQDLTNIRWGFQKAIEIQSGIISVEDAMKEDETKNSEITQPGMPSAEQVVSEENNDSE